MDVAPRDAGQRQIDRQAADWFARLRAPDGERSRAEFERWRTGDARRAAAFAEYERLWRASAALAATDAGRARQLPSRRNPWSRPPVRMAFAALLLLAFVGGGYLLRLSGIPSEAVPEAHASLTTKIGEIRTVRIGDTVVTLDTDSRVEVESATGEQKLRLLRGRARFSVGGTARPGAIILAGDRRVSVRGAEIDVALHDERVEVVAVRGSADVHAVAPDTGALVRLAAGERYAEAGEGQQVSKALAGATKWPSGMLDFDAAPLGDVLGQTNRYSQRKIHLGSPSLAALRVTGSFRPLPADALAGSLAAALSLDVVPDGPDLLLTPRK